MFNKELEKQIRELREEVSQLQKLKEKHSFEVYWTHDVPRYYVGIGFMPDVRSTEITYRDAIIKLADYVGLEFNYVPGKDAVPPTYELVKKKKKAR